MFNVLSLPKTEVDNNWMRLFTKASNYIIKLLSFSAIYDTYSLYKYKVNRKIHACYHKCQLNTYKEF